jgi:ribosome-binding protein aMBF1 (putative translation factor)
MPSFQITLSPGKRAAGRFVHAVRRSLQRTLMEERDKRGLTQSAIANAIGVHRSVINRELRGEKDITLGRVAELAWALGRKAVLTFPERTSAAGQNIAPAAAPKIFEHVAPTSGTVMLVRPFTAARAA